MSMMIRTLFIAALLLPVMFSLTAAEGPPKSADPQDNSIVNPSNDLSTVNREPALQSSGMQNPAQTGSEPLRQDASGSHALASETGDINLNGVPNEVADAVLYTQYFIYGLGALHIDLEAQVMASDVNNDGLTLSIGDLVYMIQQFK